MVGLGLVIGYCWSKYSRACVPSNHWNRKIRSLHVTQHFTGTDQYIATDSLKQKQLVLCKSLYWLKVSQVNFTCWASCRKSRFKTHHFKSTTKAQQGLYEYDAVSLIVNSVMIVFTILRTILSTVGSFHQWRALCAFNWWKADIEFPNDLLHELDKMSFMKQAKRLRLLNVQS